MKKFKVLVSLFAVLFTLSSSVATSLASSCSQHYWSKFRRYYVNNGHIGTHVANNKTCSVSEIYETIEMICGECYFVDRTSYYSHDSHSESH